MHSLEAAIMRTVLYADVFKFAMTVEEIHHFLIIDHPVTLEAVRETLDSSAYLRERLCVSDGYVAINGDYIVLRLDRAQISARAWPNAVKYGRWLARLPFVRMVALTGALAMHNPSDEDDDIDYLLVTARGRVWLARAFAVLLVRLAKLRGVIICPNYVVAEDSLAQGRRDLYIAHEVTQAVPLYGHMLYEALRAANPWTVAHLPNSCEAFRGETEIKLNPFWGGVKSLIELPLSARIGDTLERWEYQRKLKRFSRKMQTPHSAAALDSSQVKGHFQDHGHPVLRRYEENLQHYGLAAINNDYTLPLAGD